MKQFILAVMLLAAVQHSARAQSYPVTELPDSLIRGASAVTRLSESKVIVKSLHSIIYRTRSVVTILNEGGDEYAELHARYDKLQKINSISGAIYDARGNLIKKTKPRDFKDVSAVSEVNLDDDNRMKVHRFVHHQYPYTVEYAYETEIGHSFFIPAWTPQTDEHVSIQRSSYSVEFPASLNLRRQQFNLPDPQVTGSSSTTVLTWQLDNRPAFKTPEFFGSWRDYLPAVFIAASDFQLEKARGNMESWKSLGLFLSELMKGRDELPASVKEKVRELTAQAGSDREKVETLYNYLQTHTRYISIQLGIGGWQPFDAAYVARNGYGDCKALTNYMLSLLKEAGIPSYYTLIYAGANNFARNRVITDFPSNQFNHVILCVPIPGQDTVWLECTSQSLPAGYLGGFTANRTGLLVKHDGGYLVSTPRYGLSDNGLVRKTRITLAESGSADITVETSYTGLQQDELFSMVKTGSPDDIRRFLSRTMPISSYVLQDYNYEFKPSALPELKEQLTIDATHLATTSGKRIFLTPNIFSKSSLQMKADTARRTGFHFNMPFRDDDTVEISMPAGYSIEAPIKPVSIITPFLKYEMSCTLEGDKIIYKRVREQYATSVPPEGQEEIVNAYNEMYKADRARLVLVNK